MAAVKSQCVTAVATVAGWSGILLTWSLGVFHQAAACADGLLPSDADGEVHSTSGRLLRRGSTHHRYLSVGRRRIGHHSDHAVRRLHRSQRDGVRDFAIVGMASMAAVSVTAAPAMGLLIVDSMTVPVDQRYSEGMLGAFSVIARVCLIAGVCLVKGGGKTYHWVVDVR